MIHKTFNNLNQVKKERILTAAKKEFINRGLDSAKVQHICTEAEIPRSAFYRYFDSLEDCLEAVFENMRDEKAKHFQDLLGHKGKNSLKSSVKVLEEVLDDEETFLFMMSLVKSESFNLPMIKKIKAKIELPVQKKLRVVRNTVQRTIRGLAEDYYIHKRPKKDCIEEYKIFIQIIEKGVK